MPAQAPRQPRRLWRRPVRGVLMGLFLWLAGSIGQGHAQTVGHTPLQATVLEAHFYGPTTEYRHALLGDAIEWSGLALAGHFSDGTPMTAHDVIYTHELLREQATPSYRAGIVALVEFGLLIQ